METLRTILPGESAEAADTVRDDLAPLLGLAAGLNLADDEAGARLRQRAHLVTSRLVAEGRLPVGLLVATDDPLVVVTRTLAAAWRRTAPTWSSRVSAVC